MDDIGNGGSEQVPPLNDIEELLKGIDHGNNSRTTRDSDNSTVHSSTNGWSGSSSGRERDEQEGQETAGSIQEEVRGLTDVGYSINTSSDPTDTVYSVPSDSSDTSGDSGEREGDGEETNGIKDETTATNKAGGLVSSEDAPGHEERSVTERTNGQDREESKGRSETDAQDRSEAKQAGEEKELPDLPAGVTNETIDRVVSSAWLSWMMEGSVNVEFIKQNLPKNISIPKGWTLGKLLLLPHVAEKLEARGVPKPDESDILSPKQIQALVVITNARNMKWAARLKQAGVTVAEWQSWLKQPNFRMVYDKYAEGRLRDAIPEGISALSDKAADGDLNAVKLVLEMTGRHDPNGGKEVNIQAILVGIVEILQQEVSDMEVLMRVVNRIKGLQTGIGIGTGNIKGEIE